MYSITVEKDGVTMRLADRIQLSAFLNNGWKVMDELVHETKPTPEVKKEEEKVVEHTNSESYAKRGRKRKY